MQSEFIALYYRCGTGNQQAYDVGDSGHLILLITTRCTKTHEEGDGSETGMTTSIERS